MSFTRRLPENLEAWREKIEVWAEEYGLDPYTTVFEVLDYRQMNEVASYGGFPTRYPHWRFGMEYDRLSKGYTFGLSKIYELVINNDPCYAYLLEANSELENKIVMAHVFAHSDFFRHNETFSTTNRKMMDEMANHGTRIRRYVDKFGLERVESFLDTCLALDNLIDIHAPYFTRSRARAEEDGAPDRDVPKIASKSYMSSFVNPPDFMESQKRRIEREREREKRFPEDPAKDVLQFLLEYSPLESWQRDVLSIVREEAYYFAPQRQTKIMNEGWATFWHSKIMTEKVLDASELVDYADIHSGTVGSRPGVLNPYKIGLELFRWIKMRWDKGRFGREYAEADLADRRVWDTEAGEGLEKIFEVRQLYNDVSFIDTFLTEEFCHEQKLFTYEFNHRTGRYEIATREFDKIKEKLLFSLTNFGDPFIYVVDGNFRNRGELLLHHQYQGMELRREWAPAVMAGLQQVWQRPVHVETIQDDKPILLSHDGEEFVQEQLEEPLFEF